MTVNGEDYHVMTSPWSTIAGVLRDDLSLKGTRTGCKEGECGSCTLLVDDRPVRACLTLAAQVEGRNITTVEGFSRDPLGRSIQQAFVDHFAAQCGFCTAGMMAVVRHYLVDESISDHADEGRIRAALDAVACRCTGYHSIVTAVKALALARGAI